MHSSSSFVPLNPFVSHFRRNSWCDPFKSWQKVQCTLFDLPPICLSINIYSGLYVRPSCKFDCRWSSACARRPTTSVDRTIFGAESWQHRVATGSCICRSQNFAPTVPFFKLIAAFCRFFGQELPFQVEVDRVSSPPFLVFMTYALEWCKGASTPLHCSHNGVLSVMGRVIFNWVVTTTTQGTEFLNKVLYKTMLCLKKLQCRW